MHHTVTTAAGVSESGMTRRPKKSSDVSLIVRRRILPGMEQRYETLISRLNDTLMQHVAGSTGTSFVRPAPGDKFNEYTIVLKFRDYASMMMWESSDVLTQALKELDAMTAGVAELEFVSGIPLIHTLFNVPNPFGGSGHSGSNPHPPKWKTCIMIVFALFLSIIWVGEPWGAYLADKHLPEFIDVVVNTCPTVYFTSYVTAPVFGWVTARWMFAPRFQGGGWLYRFLCDGFPCFTVARPTKQALGGDGQRKTA